MTSRFAALLERGRARLLARACAITASSLASLVAAPAHAQVDLSWTVAPGCPPASFVTEKVRALAGAELRRAEPLRADGTIERVGEQYRLTLRVRDTELRERVITSYSCSDLAGAAAVALALLLKAGAEDTAAGATERRGGDESRDRAAGAGSAEAKRAVREPGAPNTANTGATENGTDFDDGPTEDSDGPAFIAQLPVLTLDYGPLPRANTGAGLGVGLKHARFRFVVGVRSFLAQSLASATRARTGAEVRRSTGVALACRAFGGARVEFSPCVALTLEHLTARGFGTGVASQSRAKLWVAPGVTLVTHVHAFEHLALFAEVGARVEVSRPRLVIDQVGEVAQLSSAAFSGSIGAEWIF